MHTIMVFHLKGVKNLIITDKYVKHYVGINNKENPGSTRNNFNSGF